MALWLFKQEPTCYSFADLRATVGLCGTASITRWPESGLRQVKRGDRVLFYHTGKEKAVVGVMRAAADAREAPSPEDPKAVVVEVEAVRPLARPVTLAEIKGDPLFRDWELVRLARLSVMPATESQWRRIEELGAAAG